MANYYYFNQFNLNEGNRMPNMNLNSMFPNQNTNPYMQEGNYNNNRSNYNNFQKQSFQPQIKRQNQVEEQFAVQQSLKYVQDRYPNLIQINKNSNGTWQNTKSQICPRFFVIKSFTEEDIHKVIIFIIFSQLNIIVGHQLKKEIKS